MPWRDAILLAGVASLWGFNFVPIRWALDEMPPFALAAARFTLAAFPLVLLVPRPRIPLRHVVGYGLAIGVGQFGILFLAIRLGMPAGLASLLMQVQVFFTIGLAALALGDRASVRQLGGALTAAAGIGVLLVGRAEGAAGVTLLGLVLVLAAAASWAAGNVLAKHVARRHDADAFGLVVWSSLVPPLPLAAMSWLAEGGPAAYVALAEAGPRAWGSVLFMAWAATLWGFAAWNRMLHRHSAAAVTPFALLVPVAGLASAALILGEPLGARELLAAGLVLSGLAIALLGPFRPSSRATSPDPRSARR